MAPCRERQAAGSSAAGTEGGGRQGDSQASKRPEGWGQKGIEENSGGGLPETRQGRGRQNAATPKMAPGFAAVIATTLPGGLPCVSAEGDRTEIPEYRRERPPPAARVKMQPQMRRDPCTELPNMRRREQGGGKMAYPCIHARSKSLPPHVGLQEFSLKDDSICLQSQSCDNFVTSVQQQVSHQATLPLIPQSEMRNMAIKACKNVKRTGHILQRKETLSNVKQVQRAAPIGAKEPQRYKISPASPRSAKKENIRGPGTTPPSPNGFQPSRPKNWLVKETKMTDQGRGKRPASQYCPSRPLYTCTNTTGTGPPLRTQVNSSSTGTNTENNETLLLYMEKPNPCEGHKWAFGQILIIAASLEINRGTWPPEMSSLLREDIRPLELSDSYSNCQEARKEKALGCRLT